jgi:hypothetical protein
MSVPASGKPRLERVSDLQDHPHWRLSDVGAGGLQHEILVSLV